MTQTTAGDWPIDATVTDGNLLADKLNRLTAAIASGHKGTTRPPGSAAGVVWSRSAAAGATEVVLFDGTADRVLLTVTSAGAVSAANAASATDLANAIASLQGQISAVSSVPKGMIAMWSGSIGTIPAGWALCNGGNGTPNLQDRFVIAAGSGYAVGATGGRTAITEVISHDHAVGSIATAVAGWHGHGVNDPGHGHQVGDPGHSHSYTDDSISGTNDNIGVINANKPVQGPPWEKKSYLTTGSAGTGIWIGGNYTGIGIAGDGNHQHSMTGRTAYAGQSSIDIRNPYYALAYIMKL